MADPPRTMTASSIPAFPLRNESATMASFASFQTEIEQYSKQSKAAQQQQQAPQSPIKKVQRHQVKPAIPVPSLATKENEHALPKQGPPIEDSDDGRTILVRRRLQTSLSMLLSLTLPQLC